MTRSPSHDPGSGSIRQVRLGLVGFGSVGRAFAELVTHERDWILAERGVDLVISGITTGRFGSITDSDGIDVAAALDRARRNQLHGKAVEATRFTADCPADIIVETMPLEPFHGTQATAVIREALTAGRCVVSANKGPVAHACAELNRLAADRGVTYRYESAVADGMPVFNLIRSALPAADITGMQGILNSTTTVVLEALARGETLDAAVLYAQKLGITESDPSYDLDGWDATVKLAALTATIWDTPLGIHSVAREPIGTGTAARAADTAARGRRLVSLASAERDNDGTIQATVRMAELATDNPFYSLTGASLGLRITSRLLCPIGISSHNPTPRDTAYGLLTDILAPTEHPR